MAMIAAMMTVAIARMENVALLTLLSIPIDIALRMPPPVVVRAKAESGGEPAISPEK